MCLVVWGWKSEFHRIFVNVLGSEIYKAVRICHQAHVPRLIHGEADQPPQSYSLPKKLEKLVAAILFQGLSW